MRIGPGSEITSLRVLVVRIGAGSVDHKDFVSENRGG